MGRFITLIYTVVIQCGLTEQAEDFEWKIICQTGYKFMAI